MVAIDKMKRATVYMRILGVYLLLMAFAGLVLLILLEMGIVSEKGTSIGGVSGVVEILIMVMLGVWCLFSSKASWYAAIYYLFIAFIYHAIRIEILSGFWNSNGVLQVAMLALYSGLVTRVLSSKTMVSGLGLEKGIVFINFVSLALILMGFFILIGFFFHVLIAVIFVIIVTPVLVRHSYVANAQPRHPESQH